MYFLFQKTTKTLSGGRSPCSLRSWLYLLIRVKAQNWLEKKRRKNIYIKKNFHRTVSVKIRMELQSLMGNKITQISVFMGYSIYVNSRVKAKHGFLHSIAPIFFISLSCVPARPPPHLWRPPPPPCSSGPLAASSLQGSRRGSWR